MEDSFFRKLSLEEEEPFRQWARDHANEPEWREQAEILHPVVRDEWRKIDVEGK